MQLTDLIARARTSAISNWWLNAILRWKIPFNRPHGFRVEPMKDGGIKVHVPYWRVNRNHIRGIHACAMATAAEYCSGLALLEHLDPTRFRLIMKTLHMDYHYQAKARAMAFYVPDTVTLEREVLGPLKRGEAVLFTAVVELHDVHQNHLATGHITWQVKSWSRVRTSR